MIRRLNDTIYSASEITDYETIGELSLSDAEFMPILILKNAYTFQNYLDPNIGNYLTMEAIRYELSPEIGIKISEIAFRECTVEDFSGVEDQLEVLK